MDLHIKPDEEIIKMPEKIGAIKLTWDIVAWICSGIAVVFGAFVRWYMMDVKGDIQELKETVKENDKAQTKALAHAHERIDKIYTQPGKCLHCGK